MSCFCIVLEYSVLNTFLWCHSETFEDNLKIQKGRYSEMHVASNNLTGDCDVICASYDISANSYSPKSNRVWMCILPLTVIAFNNQCSGWVAACIR